MPLHSSVLKYIESVARYGTIREAARKLNVASSSINRQILTLEAEYGVRLFERINNGVRLTPAGELLVEHIRRTSQDFDVTLSKLVSLKGLKSGRVTVATVPSLATTVLPTLIVDFKRRYPNITFQVKTSDSERVSELIAKGDFDVGFGFNPSPHFEVRQYYSIDVDIGCVVPAKHRLAAQRTVSITDCLRCDLILPSQGLSTRYIIDRFFSTRRIRPTTYTDSDSLAFIKALVLKGAGVALQPNMGLEPELSQGRIFYRPVHDADFGPDRLVLITGNRELAPASQVFVDHACHLLRSHLGGTDSMRFNDAEYLSFSGLHAEVDES